MNPLTLKALEQSIEKWIDNTKALTPDAYQTSANDCPLCNLFFDDDCFGCPVAMDTHRPRCLDTPYDKANWSQHPDIADFRAAAHEAAQLEVDFLKGLLP